MPKENKENHPLQSPAKILKVYMTDFFICSIKSPQCADKCSKKVFSIAIFLSRVLMYQKHQISLPVGYKTVRPKTGDWERLWRHFRTSSFAKNRFLQRFSHFRKKQGKIVQFLSELISSPAAHQFSRERKKRQFAHLYSSVARYCTHRWWQIKCCTWIP